MTRWYGYPSMCRHFNFCGLSTVAFSLRASSSAWSLRNYLWDAWVHPCNYILSDIRSNCETAMNELGSYIDLLWSCFSLALSKHLSWFLWPLCSSAFTGWSWPCLWQSESQPHSSRRSQVIILLLLCPQIAETDPTHKLTCQQQHKHKSRQHPGYSLEAHWSL